MHFLFESSFGCTELYLFHHHHIKNFNYNFWKIIHRQRRELTQNFDNLAALLNFNLNQPIPERPELLQMAHDRIIQLRQQLATTQSNNNQIQQKPWKIEKMNIDG